MKYGCIGEHLKHSFSKEIHNMLADYEYELKEVSRENLHDFMIARDFQAINVTIPYKEEVIPYLYYIDSAAKEIGAVNTIVNKDGKLYGYNTDFYGMSMLISHGGICLKNKKVAILGTGGTSKTANSVAKSLLAKEILVVSRTKKNGIITYEELYENHKDLDVIINTTPLGMFPKNDTKPANIDEFSNLSGVIDAVYNPLKTKLIYDAQKRGIKAEGGLYMLVAQALLASEIFLDKKYPKERLDEIFSTLKKQKENIVLIGMPSSGKSTVGKELAARLCRKFYDTDIEIEKKENMSIPKIIALKGEEAFRKIEKKAVEEVSKETGAVIATGGGVVLKEDNIEALKQNGRIYFLDRPLDMLLPTEDRPLTSTKEALMKKYNERYSIYELSADVKIDGSGNVKSVADEVMNQFKIN